MRELCHYLLIGLKFIADHFVPLVKYFADKILPSLVGTAVGALLAFRTKHWQDKHDETERQIASANYALFTLIDHFTDIVNIEQEIAPWRLEHKKRRRWLEMKPLIVNTERSGFQVADLGWLLETDDRNLLQKLLISYKSYSLLFFVLERRNQTKLKTNDSLEIAAHANKLESTDYLANSFVRSILTQRQIFELNETADQLLDSSQRVLLDHFNLIQEFHTAMKAKWQDRKIINIPIFEEIMKEAHLVHTDNEILPDDPSEYPTYENEFGQKVFQTLANDLYLVSTPSFTWGAIPLGTSAELLAKMRSKRGH